MKRFFLAAAFLLCISMSVFSQNNTEIPKGKIEVFESFEHGNYWIWAGTDYDQYGYHKYSMGADITKNWATEGKHCLALRWEAIPKDVNWYDGIWFYDGRQNFEGTKYIVIDVYNPTSSTFNFCLVLQCTDSWSWNDCGNYTVTSGKHTLIFDVSNVTEENLKQVMRINIQMMSSDPLKEQSSIYIDNIRLIK